MILTRERRTKKAGAWAMPRAASARTSAPWKAREVLVDRGGRQTVAVDDDQRGRTADPLGQLGARLVGERAAEIGALQEGRLVGRARGELEHPQLGEQRGIDLGHTASLAAAWSARKRSIVLVW